MEEANISNFNTRREKFRQYLLDMMAFEVVFAGRRMTIWLSNGRRKIVISREEQHEQNHKKKEAGGIIRE